VSSRRFSVAFVASVAASLAVAGAASAATVTPDSTTDDGTGCTLREAITSTNTDADFGGCTHTGTYGADTIALPAGTYGMNDPGGFGDNANAGGDFDIDAGAGLTIDGAGAATTTITASGAGDRVLDIRSGTAVAVDGTTLSDANTFNEATARGGGIRNDGGNLTVTDSAIVNNTTFAPGAGIETSGAVATQITNSNIEGNIADPSGGVAATGGGIDVSSGGGGSLTLTNSKVEDNKAEATSSTASGGGIYFAPASSATLSVTDSRLVNNHVDTDLGFAADGGGVTVAGASGSTVGFTRTVINDNDDFSGTNNANADVYGGGVSLAGPGATFTDSWIRDNEGDTSGTTADNRGAGIYNNSTGAVRLVGTTVSSNAFFFGGDKAGAGIYNLGTLVLLNSSVDSNTSSGGVGGGLVQAGGSATVVNSTIASNGGSGGNLDRTAGTLTARGSISDDSCSGTITTGGFNVGADDTCWSTSGTDVADATVDLGALQDNGGPDAGGTNGGTPEPIPTREPTLATSDAIDRIPAASCTNDSAGTLTVDQRDVSRPYDGNGDSTAECDSGAVEVATCQGAKATIVGNNGDDTITGTSGADVIAAGDGADAIDPGVGSDKVCGDAGPDTITGNAADTADTYDGGAGSSDGLSYVGASTGITANLTTGTASGGDSIVPGTIENLQGGPLNDNLTGDAGANLIAGGAGTDTITGLGGTDDLDGEANNDSIFARDGVHDTINCAGDAADSVETDASGVDLIDPSCESVSFFVPPPTPTPPSNTTPGPTGQRAAALKKCKKKKSAQARKKCKKKANRLPV
jgi:RTX calcium-binding nonapeptide repeat (4 copies)